MTILDATMARGVLGGVLMPLRAVSLRPLPSTTVSVDTAPHILGVRDGLNVVWANTRMVATKMVSLYRKVAVLSLKDPAMGQNVGATTVGSAANTKTPVSVGVGVGGPNPALPKFWALLGNWPVLAHLRPEAVFNGLARLEWCTFHSPSVPLTKCTVNSNSPRQG